MTQTAEFDFTHAACDKIVQDHAEGSLKTGRACESNLDLEGSLMSSRSDSASFATVRSAHLVMSTSGRMPEGDIAMCRLVVSGIS